MKVTYGWEEFRRVVVDDGKGDGDETFAQHHHGGRAGGPGKGAYFINDFLIISFTSPVKTNLGLLWGKKLVMMQASPPNTRQKEMTGRRPNRSIMPAETR